MNNVRPLHRGTQHGTECKCFGCSIANESPADVPDTSLEPFRGVDVDWDSVGDLVVAIVAGIALVVIPLLIVMGVM